MHSHATLGNSSKERVGFVIFAIVIGSLVWLTHSSASKQDPSTKNEPQLPTERRSSPTPASCPVCPPPKRQVIYAPLSDLPEASSSEIVLNCRSGDDITITPTFYTLDGEPFVADDIVLHSAEMRFVDTKSLIPKSERNRHKWGGMTFSYVGGLMEAWAQLTLHGIRGGESVNVLFTVLSQKRSNSSDAVWWTPRGGAAAIALGNSSDQKVQANLTFPTGKTHAVEIAPFATEIVRLHSNILGPASSDRIESVSIKYTGPEGSLIPTGYTSSNDGMFASMIRFYDTSNAVQENLFANNLRLRNAAPHMVLKNVSSDFVTATPTFLPANGDSYQAVRLLPVKLAPNDMIEIDLAPLLQAASNRRDLESVSVQVLNSGQKGSLIGALYSVNTKTGVNYDVPLRDSGPSRASTGGYPIRLDGDYSTVLTIANTTDEPGEFLLQINYPGGPYVFGITRLEPRATKTFDIRKLRDSQTPDIWKHTLPANLKTAQAMWGSRSKVRLNGRSEIVSIKDQVSSSYSCAMCCQPTLHCGWLEPGAPGSSCYQIVQSDLKIPVGGTQNYTIIEVDWICGYGESAPVYVGNATWHSDSPSVAEVGSAIANGLGSGSAQIEADWDYTRYQYDDLDESCEEIPDNYTALAGTLTVVDFPVEANVSSIRPSGTGGTNTTTIKVLTNPVWANTAVHLSLSAGPASGGHVSHSGTRPLGSLAATDGTTNAQGIFETTYTAPIFGQSVYVSGTLDGTAISRYLELLVQVGGLDELGASADYFLKGEKPTHPSNHFGTATALTNLPLIASDYLSQYPGADILWYNDMSLIWGGKFDFDGNDWCSGCSHDEHRVGINCDVGSSNVPSGRWSTLTAIFAQRGSPNYLDETSHNHWHLRFQ
jgi:hypothetical protein